MGHIINFVFTFCKVGRVFDFSSFLAVLIYRKKWKSFPILAFGTAFYTIVGSFHYNDLFWLIHQNPYKGLNYNIYGQGEFLHFINEYDLILGASIGLLFLLGLLSAVFLFVQKRKNIYTENDINAFNFEEHFLIYGSFLAYFFAHTIFWWKGMGSSLGLIRVMAAVIPCSALICLRGFSLIMLPVFVKKKLVEWSIIITLSSYIIFSCFNYEFFPYKLNAETIVLKEAADWYKASSFKNKKVYYLYPYLAQALDVDAFDESKVGELWGLYPSLKQWGPSVVPDSSIIFWDGHFGPNEGAIALDTILKDPIFDLVKIFKPKTAFQTLGGQNFEVYVFMKLPKPKSRSNLAAEFYDLEMSNKALENTVTISNSAAYSGKKSCRLANDVEFGVNIIRKRTEIPLNTTEVAFTCKLLDDTKASVDAKIVMVIDDKDGKNLYWAGVPFETTIIDGSPWKNSSAGFTLNAKTFPTESIIKFYVWNIAKKEFYIDDLEIIYWGWK